MQLIDLKKSILEKTTPDYLIIFLCSSDSKFIAYEYINSISEFKNLEINYIDELVPITSLFDNNKYLNVYMTDKLETINYNITDLNNTIIVCESCKQNIKESYNYYITEIPKLENWQIKEFVKFKLPGLTSDNIETLCNITKYDIYRLNNEIIKLRLFNPMIQNAIFKELDFSDLKNFTMFDLTNAIIKRDTTKIKQVIDNINFGTLEPYTVLNTLIKQFRYVINIQMNSKATPQSLGISPKQFKAIEYSCGYYTNDQLVDIYDFLTLIDYKVKLGLIDIKYLIAHIIINIMSM